MVLSPDELLENLAALVPPPRLNLVRYHGVLAPNAVDRAQIVPGPKEEVKEEVEMSPESTSEGDPTPAQRRHRLAWAVLRLPLGDPPGRVHLRLAIQSHARRA